MRFEIELSGFVHDDEDQPISSEKLETLCDLVMEELVRLEATDPAVAASGKNASFEFSLVVEKDTEESALAQATSLIRSAIHAAGVGTPSWPTRWYTLIDPHAQLLEA